MKKILILCLFPVIIYSQNQLPYKIGEHSFFDISFEGINVGFAEIEIKKGVKINNIPTYHIVAYGRTALFFDWFFKVRDLYETYIDTINIRPVKFFRDIKEGGYTKKQLYKFRHSENLVFTKDTSYSIYKTSQDMLSALFFARTFSKKDLKQNKAFFVPIFMDEENYLLEIIYLYNETVKTNFGDINCMVFQPKMQEGRVFQDGEKMKVWISDDQNRLLVKVETEIWAGTIKANLVEVRNTRYRLIKEN